MKRYFIVFILMFIAFLAPCSLNVSAGSISGVDNSAVSNEQVLVASAVSKNNPATDTIMTSGFVSGIGENFDLAENIDNAKDNQVKLEIISGVDVKKESESTFDSSRTIVGTSLEGADIVITVSVKAADGSFTVKNVYEINVGALGIFSQSINLDIGENLVGVEAISEDYESASVSYTIKRKNRGIKKALESTIVLPSVSIEKSAEN